KTLESRMGDVLKRNVVFSGPTPFVYPLSRSILVAMYLLANRKKSMRRERTRAWSRIRLQPPCDGPTKNPIVERIFVGTKLTITAPSQNGTLLRNPPTGSPFE